MSSCRAVSALLTSLVFPVFPALAQLLVIVFWASTAILIASAGKPLCQIMSAPGFNDSSANSILGMKCSCRGVQDVQATNHSAFCQFARYVPIR